MRRRDVLTLAGWAAAAALRPTRGFAQGDAANWPSGNVTLVSPFTPGGMSDVLGRALGEKLAPVFGKSFVVENRAGAGGTLGATSVARATPDGLTLLIAHIGILAVNPSLYANLQYQPLTSFKFVAPLALVPNVLVINPKLPVHNIAELIAYAKANPGQLNYSSAGIGGAAHIAMAAFNVATGTRDGPRAVPRHAAFDHRRDLRRGAGDLHQRRVAAAACAERRVARARLRHAEASCRGAGHSGHRRNGAGLRGVVVVRHRRARRHARRDRAAALSRGAQGDGLAGDRAAAEQRRRRALGHFARSVPRLRGGGESSAGRA